MKQPLREQGQLKGSRNQGDQEIDPKLGYQTSETPLNKRIQGDGDLGANDGQESRPDKIRRSRASLPHRPSR